MTFHHPISCFVLSIILGAAIMPVPASAATPRPLDQSCDAYEAWTIQGNPRSDPDGFYNIAYPESNATYWGTTLTAPIGTTATITGRYPKARYMALQVYDVDRNVKSAINDAGIDPDAGQNNPYRTGADQGTYTVTLVFGRTPARPAPNTLYTGGLTTVLVLYRIYYSNNPDDLSGGTSNPQLPNITMNGRTLSSCPVRPVITPEDNTAWGRLDDYDWTGRAPLNGGMPTTYPPTWNLSVTNGFTPYYPSADNSYMGSIISRKYLAAPYRNDVVVFRFRAPTFANTQAGEAPYLANTTKQMRFWSVCQDDPLTTSVMRCIPDNQVAVDANGFATFVISDPSKKPSATALTQYSATWVAWGALAPGDQIYDINHNLLNNDSGVYYQGAILYRQTVPNPSFSQSMTAVSALPRSDWKTAMGDYWPTIGYCALADFEALGPNCYGRQQPQQK